MADDLVIRVYQETKCFPKEELYGLVSQMRRSAVSVATNIVEGCGRRTETEFNRFLDIAFGSIRDVGYLVDLAARLGYLDEKEPSVSLKPRVVALPPWEASFKLEKPTDHLDVLFGRNRGA